MAEVIVIGAGMAGLLAAEKLQRAGHRVVVLDKGRGVGGRMATRRLGDARIDHGAQFFTVRDDRFAALNQRWLDGGVTRHWCDGFGASGDGHPRYVGADGMTALAKDLAGGLDVRVGTQVTAIGPTPGGGGPGDPAWTVSRAGGEVGSEAVPLRADAVICTPPVPQTLALLAAGRTGLPPETTAALERITYSPVLAVLAVLDRGPAVPDPGGVQLREGPFTWVGDNRAKGISPVPAITLHTNAEVAARRWDDPAEEVLADLLAAGTAWLGDARVTEARLQRWRFAQPVTGHDERCLVAVDGPAPLVCAGDAFGEAKVEGAARSGWAAADAVLSRLA
jgi:renalase